MAVGPPRNALDVASTHDITATFDLEMDAGTVSTETLVAHGAQTGRLAGVVAYDGASRTATLDPVGAYKPGEVVWTTATSGTLSAQGDPLIPTVWQVHCALPPDLHRRLVLEAPESGISLNRLASAKLSQ